jgi:hypothetical protein
LGEWRTSSLGEDSLFLGPNRPSQGRFAREQCGARLPKSVEQRTGRKPDSRRVNRAESCGWALNRCRKGKTRGRTGPTGQPTFGLPIAARHVARRANPAYAHGRPAANGCAPRRPPGRNPARPCGFMWARTVCCCAARRRPRRSHAVRRGAACGQWLPATWRRLVPPRPWFVRRRDADVSMMSATSCILISLISFPSKLQSCQMICPFRSSQRARRNGVVQIGICGCL